MSSSNPTSNNQEQHHGLIADHAQYIKGATVVSPSLYPRCFRSYPVDEFYNTIGNISGTQGCSASGEETKHHAIEAMGEAGENRHPN